MSKIDRNLMMSEPFPNDADREFVRKLIEIHLDLMLCRVELSRYTIDAAMKYSDEHARREVASPICEWLDDCINNFPDEIVDLVDLFNDEDEDDSDENDEDEFEKWYMEDED